jgi:hypothetical protein
MISQLDLGTYDLHFDTARDTHLKLVALLKCQSSNITFKLEREMLTLGTGVDNIAEKIFWALVVGKVGPNLTSCWSHYIFTPKLFWLLGMGTSS